MNEREFCYWLQSAFELSGAKSFDEKQTELIRQHLQLVFEKKTDDIQIVAQPVEDGVQVTPGGLGGVTWPTIYPPYRTYCDSSKTCHKLEGDVSPSCEDDNLFGFGHMHVMGT